MGVITKSGGPMAGIDGEDGPVNAAVTEIRTATCAHCGTLIRVKWEPTNRGGRLDTDHSCPQCRNRPICHLCGSDRASGIPCRGPLTYLQSPHHQ